MKLLLCRHKDKKNLYQIIGQVLFLRKNVSQINKIAKISLLNVDKIVYNMRTQAKFKEYIWLVNTINKARAISFADIQKKWLETDMSEGIELARSTFNRHKDAIEDIFGI